MLKRTAFLVAALALALLTQLASLAPVSAQPAEPSRPAKNGIDFSGPQPVIDTRNALKGATASNIFRL